MTAKVPTSSTLSAATSRTGPLPGARAALLLLLAINLFNYIDRQVLSAVVPSIRKAFFEKPEGAAAAPSHGVVIDTVLGWLQPLFGKNSENSENSLQNSLIGLLAMAFMVTYMLAAPLFGILAQRMSRWWIVAAGVFIWTLASGASGWATTFGMLLLTRCFVGIGEAAYGPVAPDMISDLYPVKVRGSVLAWFYMAIPVGSALGFVLGGQMAGLDAENGWRWAFYSVVPPGLLLAVWCLFMREPPRGQADLADPHAARQARLKDYRILLRTPSYVLDCLGMTAMTFAMGGIGFWMPSYIHEYRHVPDLARVSLIFGGIVVISGLAATILGGMLGDKLRDRYPGSYFLVSGTAMLVGFPISIAMLYVPFPWAWIFIFLACFCLFFNTGPTNTILANVTHPAMRASGYALNILVIHAFGDVISPLIIGAITDGTGGNMNRAFLVVSAMIFLGGLLWLWGARYLERDTALAPTRLDVQS